MNEENVIENVIVYNDVSDTIYDIASNVRTILSVLTFVVIIIFLYKYLKSCFKNRGV